MGPKDQSYSYQPACMNQLNAEIYQELHNLAKGFMRRERRDHTLSPTDLFHEAYSRLRGHLPTHEAQIGQLRGLFAVAMRRVLIEHARKHSRRKRLIPRCFLEPDDLDGLLVIDTDEDLSMHLLDLDTALARLSEHYPIEAKVVELKYFGGMTVKQCSEYLEICPATVQKYWNFARAWIGREMERISLE